MAGIVLDVVVQETHLLNVVMDSVMEMKRMSRVQKTVQSQVVAEMRLLTVMAQVSAGLLAGLVMVSAMEPSSNMAQIFAAMIMMAATVQKQNVQDRVL